MNHARLLRELTLEAKAAPLPPINWDYVEENLFVTPVPIPRLHAVQSSRHLQTLVAIAAIAASIALLISSGSSVSNPGNAKVQTHLASFISPNESSAFINASSLQPGDRLVADSRAIVVSHDGQAQWSLSPGSIATIESLSPAIHISLDLGSLSAQVVPNSVHDSFVVRAEQTRVGVHGTTFSVARSEHRLNVRLSHGSVAVGPNSKRGPSSGWIMLAPSELDCSLDGASQAVFLQNPAAPLALPERQQAPVAASSAVEAVAVADLPEPPRPTAAARPSIKVLDAFVEKELPDQLSQGDVSSAFASLTSQISSCYTRLAPKPKHDGLTVSVQTTVKITVAPDGQIRLGVFDPPLAPQAQSCASAALASTTFPKAKGESQLLLPLKF